MKRFLLIALMAGGLALVPAQRSDAQVSVGSDLVIPATGIATIRMDTAITRTDTTDLIDTMAITEAPTMGIEFTAITAITTIATEL
jgi:hypothetical protein